MSLYESWISIAYDSNGKSVKKTWDVFMPKEQKIYEHILANKISNMSATLNELAEKFSMSELEICGFLDGINDIQPEPYDMSVITPDTHVSIDIDFENLYKKMVEVRAEHLYSLSEWETIFSKEKLEELYLEQRNSKTYVRTEHKIGRNDPCICGSGKKYKKCCGMIG